MKYKKFDLSSHYLDLNEIYTEPKQDKHEWVWWVVLTVIITYFIGHIILSIIR